MTDYRALLPYYGTYRQKDILESLIKFNGNKRMVCEDQKVDKDNLNRMIRSMKKRQSSKEIKSPNETQTDAPFGYSAKGISNYYNKDGDLSGQWVKLDRDAEEKINAIKEAVDYIMERVEGVSKPAIQRLDARLDSELLNLYISNDLHFGALAWAEETQDRDYNLDIADELLEKAMDRLVMNSPQAKTAIVADLGDMTEMDDFKNATPGHGHPLDVDSRYSRVIRVAMEAMVKLIDKALLKHETVHFINISGNHDVTTGHATRAFISAWYRNEPRVIVCEKPTHQKYYQHGTTLLGFAHGDGLKMNNAGELMASQCADIFSSTIHRFFHFGHNHKDKIVDGILCKAESHRNLAPLNDWASHAGFSRQLGSMKCLTYSSVDGHTSTTLFNVGMK